MARGQRRTGPPARADLRGRVASAAGAAGTAVARARREPERAGYLAAHATCVLSSALGLERPRRAAKTALMPLLAGSVLRRRRRIGAPGTAALLTGLGLAWAGDLVLLPARPDLNRGAVPFAGAHAVHQWLMRRAGARHAPGRALPRALAWAGAAALVARRAPALLPATLAYGAVLGAGSALGADPALLAGAGPVDLAAAPLPRADARHGIGAGADLFLLSDGLLLARAALADPGSAAARLLDAAVMDTYATAQLLLVDGLARAEEARP
ncbi:lysoplasmalogenase family protein [Corynebacterium sphenisci]|uniref:lysoplasmalogenase family protein n=1 Tax=Corynebacterium sphenisci TaxID=191493 RepID=UPI0026DFC549|nr:lysoplasmalogenase family protein [Corynebacterium sphenisci]MDO5730525.1 lysoplasmalogenase family protein [Corynebacterium sphenisci]